MMSLGSRRMDLSLWIGLFGLGLALWFTIVYINVLLEIVWILFAALLLSLAMQPAVDYLARRHVPRGVTVLLIYAIVLGLVVWIAGLAAPIVRQELALLRADGPSLFQQSLNSLAQTGLGRWIPSTDTMTAGLVQRITPLLAGALDTLSGASRLLLDVLMVFILAYFHTTAPFLSMGIFLHWFPPSRREHIQLTLAGIHDRLTHWLWAQMTIAVLLGIVVSSGLYLLGVPFALTIGITGGFLEIIPFLGSSVALILGLLSAVSVHLWLAFWVLVFYLAFFTIESNVVAPVIYGRATGLRSALVLLVLFVGVRVQGLIGVLFAVPVSVILVAVIQEIPRFGAPPVEQSDHSEPDEDIKNTRLAADGAG